MVTVPLADPPKEARPPCQLALTDTRHVREAALDRLGAGTGSNGGNDASSRAAGETGIAGWGRAVGSWGNTDSDGNGAKLDIDTKGVLVGIDIASDTWKAGALFNALESKVDTRILGTSKVKTTGGGIYGGYRSGQGFSLAVGASVGGVKTHSSRAITVPGLTQVLTGHTSGTSYQVFGDIAYDLAAAEKTRVEPFVRFAYVAYHVDGLAESGGFAGLVSGKQKYDATFTTVGLRASTEIGKSASLRGSLGYQYTGGDRSPIASLSIQGTNQNAGIRSVALDRERLRRGGRDRRPHRQEQLAGRRLHRRDRQEQQRQRRQGNAVGRVLITGCPTPEPRRAGGRD